MLLSLYSYFKFCFRHIRIYSSIIQEHTHAYSEPCVSLAYSEHFHILTTKHIQTPSYIHNTILSIFTKNTILDVNTVLNASLLYKDTILYCVFNIIFQTYSSMFKIYLVIFILARYHRQITFVRLRIFLFNGFTQTLIPLTAKNRSA